MDKKIQPIMIKKFNEVYGGEEMDREDWPNAPKIPEHTKTPKEKIETIKNLCHSVNNGKMSCEDFFKGVSEILIINDRFPGPTNL